MSGIPRVTVPALVLMLVSGLGLVSGAGPATATSTTLCKGYDACAKLGMGNGGYKAAASTMWWRMYTGHNCTNYAAYRIVQSGLPNVRPWSGGGNATYWGTSNAAITDTTPAVGAIAWWKANVRPAGSSGHVAYVEQVVSPDEIIVSQDSWGGDFSWARITRAGGSWPSGFVHFNDVPLENTAAPAVVGTTRVGSLLTATPGSWSQEAPVFGYQWRAGRSDIAEATSPSLKLRRWMKGKRISVRVTASKVGFPTTTVLSPKTSAVEPGAISSTAAPTITGEPVVDGLLTATPGSWTPAPAALAYQWTADGQPVAGATTATFGPGPDQVGKALAVQVTAGKAGYDPVTATSAGTTPVAPGTFTVDGRPTVVGVARPGETLTLDTGGFSPTDAVVSVTWLRAGKRVPGTADSLTYQASAADLGARIAARVRLRKPGYTELLRGTRRTRLVREVPQLDVATRPGRGRVRVDAVVRGADVAPATGTVLIRSRGVTLAEVPLVEGRARTVLTELPAGPMPLRVRYLGSRVSTPANAFQRVEVR